LGGKKKVTCANQGAVNKKNRRGEKGQEPQEARAHRSTNNGEKKGVLKQARQAGRRKGRKKRGGANECQNKGEGITVEKKNPAAQEK